MTDIKNLMITMKNVLESLSEDPKMDSELLETIPNFSLELLGKLRSLDAIDHNNHLVYITSRGMNILKEMKSKI